MTEVLLESVIPAIHKMATDFGNKGLAGPDKAIEEQDLVQVGMIAAWNAALKYDKSRGVKFITYVYPAIFRAMSEEIRKLSGPVAIPQQFMQYVITSVAEAIAEWMQKYSEMPTLDELLSFKKLEEKIREGAAYETIGEPYLQDHIKAAWEYLDGQSFSFDAIESGEEYEDLVDTLPDESDEANPELMSEIEGLTDTLEDALSMLPAREEYILRLRFGLEDGKEYTIREVGAKLGVSHEMARKLENRALQTLRRLPGRFELKDWL